MEPFEEIQERQQQIRKYPVIQKIVNRAVDKYFDISEDEIILYELRDYIDNQLTWKKQSRFDWLPASILDACTRLGQDFEMLLDEPASCYRDIYEQIKS